MTEDHSEIGLIIPVSILQSNLSPSEKLIAGAIISLCDNLGACYATNGIIADVAGLSLSVVEHVIVSVSKICGLKIGVSEIGRNPKTDRVIRVPQQLVDQSAKFAGSYNYIVSVTKVKSLEPTLTETKKDRNIRWKREILFHLNTVLGIIDTRYQLTSPTSLSLRFNEGATLEDCLLIIDYKFAEWGNDDAMRPFIRPKTLFSKEHFPEYYRMANMWNDAGRPSVGRNNKNVTSEIKSELQAQLKRLENEFNLLGEESSILEINPDKTDVEIQRIHDIAIEQAKLHDQGKKINERIKGM